MAVFVHPQGICESTQVGDGTRVWAFAHVLFGAQIGRDCNVCDHVFLENDVIVGDRTTIKCGVQLWDGLRVGDDVFIGPNATFTNDKYPRSRQWQNEIPQTVVENEASIGANATILPGLRIGRQAMVGAGAVVTHDVPGGAIVTGNPARITGYVGSRFAAAPTVAAPQSLSAGARTPVLAGAALVVLPDFHDARGCLTVADFGTLPFQPQRMFFVYDVPSRHVRGEHAHRACQQLLVCLEGSVDVVVDDGQTRREVRLDSPHLGLYVPAMLWATQYQHHPNTVLAVFASHAYDPGDYIRDYDEFLSLAQKVRVPCADR